MAITLDLTWLEVSSLRQKEAELRRKERQLSSAISALGEEFQATMNARKAVAERAEKLERATLESQGKVKVLRPRKATKVAVNRGNVAESTIAKAVELAAAGKLAEALSVMKDAR